MSSVYVTSGRGIPVMLLHGYGENRHLWEELLKYLPKKYKYIMPDLPGFGKQPAEATVSMQAFAAYLNSILELERIEKIILLGHSMGGYVTMAFAEHYPEKLNAIGLLHSHVFADSEEQKQTRRKAIEFIGRNGAKKYLKDFVKNLFASTTDKKIIQAHLHTIIQTPETGLTASLQAMINRRDTSDVLQHCEVPVLFVLGRHDKLMAPERLLSQCNLPEKSMVEILEHSGHMGPVEEPKKFAGVVKSFLEWVTS